MDENEYFKILEWKDVRNSVKKVNPELADIIDNINPDKRFPLVKASYRFGDLIVKDGVPQLPTEEGLLPLDSPKIKPKVASQLSYSKIPLSLLLNKASEIFVREEDRIIPLTLFKPGELFGTFETINAFFGIKDSPIWNVSAGSRSIFMLPKLSEAGGLKKIKSYFNIPHTLHIKSITDHWDLFKSIASHHPNNTWRENILFFTKNWFLNKSDKRWFKFNNFLFEQGWRQSLKTSHSFEQIKLSGHFWQDFLKALTKRSLKPSPYLANTFSHIIKISEGVIPGFTSSLKNELIAPLEIIIKAILEIYQLKNHIPTVIYADLFTNKEKINSIYYSLNFPTLLEGSLVSRGLSTLMLDIKYIKLMMDTLTKDKIEKKYISSHIDFTYYHIDEDKEGEIVSSKYILQNDIQFYKQKIEFPDRHFCTSSVFWRGCLKIATTIQP